MPLDFAEFAHHYNGYELNDSQQRAHFETFADLMECITRLFWQDGPDAKGLGITLQEGSLHPVQALDLRPSTTISFNGVASLEADRKKES